MKCIFVFKYGIILAEENSYSQKKKRNFCVKWATQQMVLYYKHFNFRYL